jgi:hypothetical protein
MKNAVKKVSQEFIELENLVENSESKRDKRSVSELVAYVERHPIIFEITESMTNEVQEKLLAYISNENSTKKEKLQEEIHILKQQIIGKNNSNVLDRLMSEEVATCYLFLRYMDTFMCRHFTHLSSMDIRKADYASSRFTRSVNALQKLRRVMPDIHLHQVNIGRNKQPN